MNYKTYMTEFNNNIKYIWYKIEQLCSNHILDMCDYITFTKFIFYCGYKDMNINLVNNTEFNDTFDLKYANICDDIYLKFKQMMNDVGIYIDNLNINKWMYFVYNNSSKYYEEESDEESEEELENEDIYFVDYFSE